MTKMRGNMSVLVDKGKLGEVYKVCNAQGETFCYFFRSKYIKKVAAANRLDLLYKILKDRSAFAPIK